MGDLAAMALARRPCSAEPWDDTPAGVGKPERDYPLFMERPHLSLAAALLFAGCMLPNETAAGPEEDDWRWEHAAIVSRTPQGGGWSELVVDATLRNHADHEVDASDGAGFAQYLSIRTDVGSHLAVATERTEADPGWTRKVVPVGTGISGRVVFSVPEAETPIAICFGSLCSSIR